MLEEVRVAMRRTCLMSCVLAGFASPAFAEPVYLNCSATGASGSVSFQFFFDEAANQAATIWSAGGGRPSASYFGEVGTENAFEVTFTAAWIGAQFRMSAYDDPYAYRVNLDRFSGAVAYIRYPAGNITT